MRNSLALCCVMAVVGHASACRADGVGLDVTAVSATVTDAQVIALVIVGGATWGDAMLSFTDEAGVVRDVPIELAGPSVGLLMDVHVLQQDMLFDGSTTASLQIPEDGVPADELFGLYDGGGGGLALGLGVCGLSIDNSASVRLVIEGACGGLSIAHEENWLTLTADGDAVVREEQ